jgi:hypothetical protein
MIKYIDVHKNSQSIITYRKNINDFSLETFFKGNTAHNH